MVLINESCLIVGICAMISLMHNLEFVSLGQTIQTIACISIVVIYSSIPLYAFYETMRQFKDLKHRTMKQRFGAFYEGRVLRRGRKVLLHPLSFLVRRFVLVYLVVAGPEELIYQIIILITSTLLSELLLYQTEALFPAEKRLSTMNELIILQVAYCFLSFDSLEAEENFDLGYLPIIIMGSYITFCLLLILISTLRTSKLNCEVCCVKRQYHRKKRPDLKR